MGRRAARRALPAQTFPSPNILRARLVLKGDGGEEQYYYFLLVSRRGEGGVTIVVDQRNLEFPDQWFAEDIKRA
jgi:hypothetical protein